MKKIFKKFQVKDFVFLAVLSAAMTLCGGITMPLVMHTTVFGLRNMAAAPIYSIFIAIGLMKVRKPGALTIIGLFSGAPLIFFSTVMFFNNFVSAIIAELIMLLIFRGYQKKVSVFVTTGIYMPFSLPISVLFSLWLNGQSYDQPALLRRQQAFLLFRPCRSLTRRELLLCAHRAWGLGCIRADRG